MAKTNDTSETIAGKQYDSSMENQGTTVAEGLSDTHEQISDTYTDGTIETKIENVNGEEVETPANGYDE